MTDSLLLPHEIGRISYSIRSCSRCSGELQPNGGTGRRAWRCAVCDRTARDR
jgi:tRNA(Ile2) C34 agmatinyltransferase TiaS